MSEHDPHAPLPGPTGRELDVSLVPRADVVVLEQVVRRAFTRCHGMDAQLAQDTLRNQVDLTALIELLSANGVIDPVAFEAKRDEVDQVLTNEHARTWRGPSLAPDHTAPDGRVPEITLNCTERHATCHAACCVIYRVHLTAGEVRQGDLLWDLTDPYRLVRKQFGRCIYLDEGTLGCTIWASRPQVCRGYSCRQDTNIWKDFDAVEVNEALARFFDRVAAAEAPRSSEPESR